MGHNIIKDKVTLEICIHVTLILGLLRMPHIQTLSLLQLQTVIVILSVKFKSKFCLKCDGSTNYSVQSKILYASSSHLSFTQIGLKYLKLTIISFVDHLGMLYQC
jgi:hypothetical protein